MSERPYRTDDAWSQAVFARRTGTVAAFLVPHLRAGMRLLDCGCGPGTITADLAQVVAPGETIGIDLREEAVAQARALARERQIANLTFQTATIYQLPFPDGSFDAAFTCAVLQHLATPVVALEEIRRVLKPGGVLGIGDGRRRSPFAIRRTRSWRNGIGCACSSANTTWAFPRKRCRSAFCCARPASRGPKPRAS